MTAAQPLYLPNDTRTVVYSSEEYPLKPPGIFQETTGTSILADSMRSNDVVLTATHNAKAWFNGISTLILDVEGNTVFRYGGINEDRFEETNNRQILNGTSLILGAAGAHCYYHWMVDILPKLKVLETADIDLESIDHFIVRDLDWSHQMKSLKTFGIPEHKIVLASDAPNIRAELLYNVEIRNFVGLRMHHFIPEFLREKFLTVESKLSEKRRKIFIARPKGVNRPIENEEELLSFVVDNGYEVVIMEGMSFLDQALLFHSASSIITSHGGALTNIVYCKPGTEIIELFGAHVFSYYYGLANLCGLEYKAVLKTADQFDLVIDAAKGNLMDNQNSTIREASGINLSVLNQVIR